MMAAIMRRVASVKEREEQCKYLLEEISEKTAELVLTQEHTFAKRAEGMLHSVYNEFSTLRQAITGKVPITIPSGSLDDAKKGESKVVGGSEVKEIGGKEVVTEEESAPKGEGEKDDEARAEEARRKGKQIVVYQESRKPQSGKLLSLSLAAHAASAAHVEQQIAEDVALAMSLQLEQAIDLREKGVTVIPLVKPLQTMSSQGSPSISSAQAITPAPALTAPSAPTEKKKMAPPPPPPAPKTQLKRVATTEKELDPAAKR